MWYPLTISNHPNRETTSNLRGTMAVDPITSDSHHCNAAPKRTAKVSKSCSSSWCDNLGLGLSHGGAGTPGSLQASTQAARRHADTAPGRACQASPNDVEIQ